MSRPVTAVWATFVKDWKLLWPVVVLNGALLAAGALLAGEVRQLASTLSLVAGALLIVAVVHLDAPASPRADWPTRPIAPATLLAGKLSFLVITMLVPAYRLIESTARGFGFDPDRPPFLRKVTETF